MYYRIASIGLFLVLAWCVAVPSLAGPGKYNPELAPGDKAPEWNDLPGVDGKQHSLADLKEQAFVLVVFTCNSCPTAVDYEDRLIELAKFLAEHKGALVAISSNDTRRAEEDGLEGMQARAKAKDFPFLYLRDEEQTVARSYGATFTPEVFLLDKDRKVIYQGAVDDNTMADDVKVNYVKATVAAAEAGKAPEVAETVARGCTVRYRRVRK